MDFPHHLWEYYSFLVSLEGHLIISGVGGDHLVTGASGQASQGSQRCIRRFGKGGRVSGSFPSLPALL